MCANCRRGRGGWIAGNFYIGKTNPLKRRGEGNPRPWAWIRLGRLDLCFMPFNRWRYQALKREFGFHYGYFGPLEIGWL